MYEGTKLEIAKYDLIIKHSKPVNQTFYIRAILYNGNYAEYPVYVYVCGTETLVPSSDPLEYIYSMDL